MKQQVLVIHGGTSFDTYEDYIHSLKNRDLDLERLKQGGGWKSSLNDDLGEGFEVILPKMPNSENARYAEWAIWFERCSSLIDDDIVLIGHSLGGIFLAKYLAENIFPKKIKATILVASPFNGTSNFQSLKDFILPNSLEKLTEQGADIYLLQSKDDPVVPYDEVEKYERALPGAKKMIFDDKQHFNQPRFPELVQLIKEI